MNDMAYDNTQPSTVALSSSQDETPAKSCLPMQLEALVDEADKGSYIPPSAIKPAIAAAATASSSSYHHQMRKAESNERSFLRKLQRMILNEKWREMDAFLSSPEKITAYRSGFDVQKLSKSFTWQKTSQENSTNEVLGLTSSYKSMSIGGDDLNSLQVVHYACRFNPPRTIIRHLASLYPAGVMLQDKMGRLPLHYATKGSSFRLIEYLLDKDQSAAQVKDTVGKTPLHLLCENYSSSADLSKGNESISPEDNMIESTKALIRAAPEVLNIEDDDGMTAVEYCLYSGAPYDAVRKIQKASEKDWKERKRKSTPGQDSHLEIEENLIQEQKEIQKKEANEREKKHQNGITASFTQSCNIALSTRRKPRTRMAKSA